MPVEPARLRKALAGRYTIEREIGSGGMATVYLATDLRHERQVAFKVLRPELGAVLGGERFLREIHIAAGLSHPHILALHDSGEADGLLYYVMPYVEGESLRQLLDRETQLPIDEALEIARQVASALDYAHRQGVIHRDIKPENILLQEGEAVVADFGIARAVTVAAGERLTETGLSLGTPAYMSPEQASGAQELDGRSDTYSLACVMYEMLAGDPPFTGPTAPAIIARQLVDPAPSLRTVRPSAPEALERAIEKALAKVPADRYETAGAFVEAASAGAHVAVEPGVETGRERRTARRRESRRLWRVGMPVGLAAAAIIAAVLFLPADWIGGGPLQITVSNIVHVTNDPGLEFQPAISPDGEEVVYVAGPIGDTRIVVRSAIEVGSGGETRPGGEASGSQWFPTWTADGASIRFLACPRGSGCDWKAVGKLGGSVRSVRVPRAPARYAWSRDGSRVALIVGDSVFACATDHGEPELLGVHVEHAWAPHSPTWSPDGRWIAYVNGNPLWRTSANVSGASIWILDATGGDPVAVTDEEQLNVSPVWLPDSRHLLFVSDRDGSRGIYVVEVGPEGARGSPRSVLGSSDPHSISISANGTRLAYSKFTVAQNIWSVPIPETGVVSVRDAVPVTEGNQIIEAHGLSPDGGWIVFDGSRRGNADIYRMSLAGGDPHMIIDLPDDVFAPDWSPDGTEIAFYGNALGGTGHVWVVSVDGGTPTQLTDFPGTFSEYPRWSPNGLQIAFESQGPQAVGPYTVWTVSRDRVGLPWTDPVQLTDVGCRTPDWDPDGASLVCNSGNEIVRVSGEGAVLSRHDLGSAGLSATFRPRFSPDGARIYFFGYEEDGSQGVWWIPADGGTATRVVALDDPEVTVWPSLSVGPERLYLTIAEYEGDIWVMDLDW